MSGATSRARILAALHCEEPDRVPYLELIVDEAVALALLGRPPLTALQQHTGKLPNGLLRSGVFFDHPGYDPLELASCLRLDGVGTYLLLGSTGDRTEQDLRECTKRIQAQLPDPDDAALYEPHRRFIDRYREHGLALFCFLNLGLTPIIEWIGFERFVIAVHEERMQVEELLDVVTFWHRRVVQNLCTLDFDFLWAGDDLAFRNGPLVSPSVFRTLLLPYYRRIAEAITKPWLFHSDGNLLPILDDLLELGINGLHPLEPGVMALADLKRRYGRRLCLCGHISTDLLSRGTPQQVKEQVCETIRTAAPGGGYIAASSGGITHYCQPINVQAMQQAIDQYGRYPLQLA